MPVPDDVDLRVDLNTEDDTALPWAFQRDARDPALLREGAWLLVGSGKTRAVAQVAQIEGDLVWVRPLPGRSASTGTCSPTAGPPDDQVADGATALSKLAMRSTASR